MSRVLAVYFLTHHEGVLVIVVIFLGVLISVFIGGNKNE